MQFKTGIVVLICIRLPLGWGASLSPITDSWTTTESQTETLEEALLSTEFSPNQNTFIKIGIGKLSTKTLENQPNTPERTPYEAPPRNTEDIPEEERGKNKTKDETADEKLPNDECDFENSTCNWLNDDNNLSWVSGTRQDIPLIAGNYAYMPDGRSAVRMCRSLPNAVSCVRLAAYVEHDDSASLTVSTIDAYNVTITEVVDGEDRPRWKDIEITVMSSELTQVCINGYRNELEAGILAIDNIKTTRGACEKDRQYDCNNGNGVCRWKGKKEKSSWKRVLFSHDVHGGNWALQAPFIASDTLTSPLITAVTGRCIHFTYYKGPGTNTWLKTFIQNDGRKDVVFSETGDKTVHGRNVHINVARNEDFKIIFKGLSKNILEGTHIMDVFVTEDPCHIMGPVIVPVSV